MKRFKYSGECFVNDGGDSFFLATGSQSNFKGTMHARHIIWTSNASINEHYTISVILQYGCCCCYCCGGGNGNGGCSHLFVMTRKWMSVCRLSIFRCRWCETTREIKRTQKINYFTIWTVSMECFLYGSICVSSSSSVLLLFFPLATKFFFFFRLLFLSCFTVNTQYSTPFTLNLLGFWHLNSNLFSFLFGISHEKYLFHFYQYAYLLAISLCYHGCCRRPAKINPRKHSLSLLLLLLLPTLSFHTQTH